MASERKIARVKQRAAAVSKTLQQGATQSPLGAPSRAAQRPAPAGAPATQPTKAPVAPPAAALAPIGKSMTMDDLARMQNAVDGVPAAEQAGPKTRIIQGPNGLQVITE